MEIIDLIERETKRVDNDLVSIVMPAFNSAKWIKEAISSVQEQTYTHWELIISDDCSNDDTITIIERAAKNDSRLHVLKSDKNQGAALARNKALKETQGRFVAFLDSDDLWSKDKLEHQLNFMKSNHYGMCYTSYDLINELGQYKKTIRVPENVTYDSYLKRPITCTHTILFDSTIVSKDLMLMPDIKRGQDGATWLHILKTGIVGYGLDESLAMYRRHEGSLSNNKFKAIKRMWFLYRKVEKLPLLYASCCFISYAFNAVKKYI